MTPIVHLLHRRLRLTIVATTGAPERYGFRISDGPHALHASQMAYRGVASAERAARRFVDDALRAWAYAEQAACPPAYSSSK